MSLDVKYTVDTPTLHGFYEGFDASNDDPSPNEMLPWACPAVVQKPGVRPVTQARAQQFPSCKCTYSHTHIHTQYIYIYDIDIAKSIDINRSLG